MCDIYGEMSAVWDKRWRMARKRHRCDECSAPIPPGFRYLEIGSLYDHRWATLRIHEQCFELWDFVTDVICQHKGYMMIGGLSEELREAEESLEGVYVSGDGAETVLRPELLALLEEVASAYEAMEVKE